MAGGTIDAAMAKAVEDQLYSLQRQQVDRNNPIKLPRQDFWVEVGKVLNMHEQKLNSILQNEGHSQKAVTLTRRISNIRRSMADLARKRLVTFLHHTVTSDLRGSAGVDKMGLSPIDWSRHDVHEREFTDGLKQLLKKFRMNLNWDDMIYGTGNAPVIPVVPIGTTQLDSFVDKPGGLTGGGPPPIELEERAEASYHELEMDEEDRIAQMEAYPEMDQYASGPAFGEKQTSPLPMTAVAATATATTTATLGNSNGAAWELAPSEGGGAKSAPVPVPNLELEAAPQSEAESAPEPEAENSPEREAENAPEPVITSVDSEQMLIRENDVGDGGDEDKANSSPSPAGNQVQAKTLSRIKILLSQEEPVLTEDGEINLQEGDIHMLDADTAEWLIEAGVAQAAAL